jgi:hypothetical protein
MHRHHIDYFRCTECDSLQTEEPYWLAEAYADARRFTDTDVARRAFRTQVTCFFLSKLLNVSRDDRIIDWGGGDGLTTRLLRDAGLNAFNYDHYAANAYALGFDGHPDEKYRMVTAIEVLEHFAYPRQELDRVFAVEPAVFYLTTGLYSGQDAGWPYLTPYSGRHVFLYSDKALRYIAGRYGYEVEVGRNSAVYYRPGASAWRRWLVRRLLAGGRSNNVAAAMFSLLPKGGRTLTDQVIMKDRVGDGVVDHQRPG